jgi:hypothetical protein
MPTAVIAAGTCAWSIVAEMNRESHPSHFKLEEAFQKASMKGLQIYHCWPAHAGKQEFLCA